MDDISITGQVPGLWKGAVSTDWNTTSNWDDGIVPGSSTDVSISPNAVNWPVYSGNFTIGVQCHSLTIPFGASMTVTGNLTIQP